MMVKISNFNSVLEIAFGTNALFYLFELAPATDSRLQRKLNEYYCKLKKTVNDPVTVNSSTLWLVVALSYGEVRDILKLFSIIMSILSLSLLAYVGFNPDASMSAIRMTILLFVLYLTPIIAAISYYKAYNYINKAIDSLNKLKCEKVETPKETLNTRRQVPSRLPHIFVKIGLYSLLFASFCLVFYLDLIDLDNAKNLLFLVSIFALRECVINMLIEGKNAHTIFVDIDKAGTLNHFRFIFTAIIASFCGKISFLKIIPSAENIITSGKLNYNIFDEKLHDQVTRLTTGFDPYQHERNIAAAKAAVWGKVSVSAAMLAFVFGVINSFPERYLDMMFMKLTDIFHRFSFWN